MAPAQPVFLAIWGSDTNLLCLAMTEKETLIYVLHLLKQMAQHVEYQNRLIGRMADIVRSDSKAAEVLERPMPDPESRPIPKSIPVLIGNIDALIQHLQRS